MSEIIVKIDEVFATPLTEEEQAKVELEAKIAEAKAYLASTDFKMTVDYYATLTPEQQEELIAKRAEARAFLKEQGL